jgi:hypothetical protein
MEAKSRRKSAFCVLLLATLPTAGTILPHLGWEQVWLRGSGPSAGSLVPEQEWANEPIGFVSYGGPGSGTRAVQIGIFTASELQETQGCSMLDALLKSVDARAPMRAPPS